MQITQQQQGLMVDGSLMRLHVAQPKAEGRYPGVVFFSDIYQLGEPMLRLANRLAGYGYVVAAPEIFHRLERPGTVMEPGGVGRLRGNADAKATPVAAYDADARAVLDWLGEQGSVDGQRLIELWLLPGRPSGSARGLGSGASRPLSAATQRGCKTGCWALIAPTRSSV